MRPSLWPKNSRKGCLLLDEDEGRREAARRHLRTTGTVGVLRDAAELGLLDLGDAFVPLRQTTFRATSALYEAVLEEHVNRRSKSE